MLRTMLTAKVRRAAVIILGCALCTDGEARRLKPPIVDVDAKNRIVKKRRK